MTTDRSFSLTLHSDPSYIRNATAALDARIALVSMASGRRTTLTVCVTKEPAVMVCCRLASSAKHLECSTVELTASVTRDLHLSMVQITTLSTFQLIKGRCIPYNTCGNGRLDSGEECDSNRASCVVRIASEQNSSQCTVLQSSNY